MTASVRASRKRIEKLVAKIEQRLDFYRQPGYGNTRCEPEHPRYRTNHYGRNRTIKVLHDC